MGTATRNIRIIFPSFSTIYSTKEQYPISFVTRIIKKKDFLFCSLFFAYEWLMVGGIEKGHCYWFLSQTSLNFGAGLVPLSGLRFYDIFGFFAISIPLLI